MEECIASSQLHNLDADSEAHEDKLCSLRMSPFMTCCYTANPKKDGTTQIIFFLQIFFATTNLMHHVHKVAHLNNECQIFFHSTCPFFFLPMQISNGSPARHYPPDGSPSGHSGSLPILAFLFLFPAAKFFFLLILNNLSINQTISVIPYSNALLLPCTRGQVHQC
jgi:hypothetical protein